jgi:hypothetical protein
MNLFGAHRGMLEETLADMSEVSIRMSLGCNTLVHLDDVDSRPGNFFVSQGTEHEPRRVAAADGHDKAVSLGDGCPRLGGDKFRGHLGGGIGISEDFDLHESASNRKNLLRTRLTGK